MYFLSYRHCKTTQGYVQQNRSKTGCFFRKEVGKCPMAGTLNPVFHCVLKPVITCITSVDIEKQLKDMFSKTVQRLAVYDYRKLADKMGYSVE